MMIDHLIQLGGATAAQVAGVVLVVAAAAFIFIAVWEWFRARLIEQWDRDYRR